MIPRICKNCGNKFEIYPYKLKTGRGNYCSSKCFHESPETREKIRISRLGHKVSQETREKIRIKLLGRKLSKDHKYKVLANFKKYYENQYGDKNPYWKGGRRITEKGYVKILVGVKKYEFEHKVIMEEYLERKMEKDEVVHHLNRIKTDNRIENLQIMKKIDHDNLHSFERK